MSADQSHARLRIVHIRDEISFLRDVLAGSTAIAAVADPLRRRAIERSLQIISEAARHIPQEWTDRFPQIEWRAIRAMGNRLRHEYHRLDQNIIIEVLDFELSDIDHACEQLQDALRLPR